MRRIFSSADHWGAILVAAVIIITAWLVATNEIRQLDDRAKTDALVRVEQLSTSYQNDVGSTIKLVDNILTFIADYDLENGTARTQDLVQRDHLYSGVLGNVAVLGPTGNGIAFGPVGAARVSLGDRTYVREALRTNMLSIGAPVVGRFNKHLAVPFARAIRRPDGTVAGIVTSVIDIGVFAYGYDGNDFGDRGIVEIVGINDHIARARITAQGSAQSSAVDSRRYRPSGTISR